MYKGQKKKKLFLNQVSDGQRGKFLQPTFPYTKFPITWIPNETTGNCDKQQQMWLQL